jgi:ATP-dependent Lon protease
VAEDEATAVSITAGNLREYLGTPPRLDAAVPRTQEVGVARGLAWTETGGEVLLVEASMVRGRGLILTGHLGDVMKESGRAALSWVRSRGDALGIREALAHHEIHLHVPAGATPKDGPSAGVTMAVALVSMLCGVPVRADVAMTGEITLRGRVLPVGGVREKALGALRRGILNVIVPEANEPDLEDIPADLRRQIRFEPVSTMVEVLELALVRSPARLRRAPGRAAKARAAQV